jgi:hypothetical protein
MLFFHRSLYHTPSFWYKQIHGALRSEKELAWQTLRLYAAQEKLNCLIAVDGAVFARHI